VTELIDFGDGDRQTDKSGVGEKPRKARKEAVDRAEMPDRMLGKATRNERSPI